MKKITKTNAARLLDRAKVAYELIPYEVDESDLAAGHVADQLGEDIHCVFKTLVLHGDRSGYFVCVIPGNFEVDLKVAAKISGNKNCEIGFHAAKYTKNDSRFSTHPELADLSTTAQNDKLQA